MKAPVEPAWPAKTGVQENHQHDFTCRWARGQSQCIRLDQVCPKRREDDDEESHRQDHAAKEENRE
jgi:hypothetical protein